MFCLPESQFAKKGVGMREGGKRQKKIEKKFSW
jgi:hypothetical protein